MGRNTPDEIDRICRTTSIEQVATAYGVKLAPTGKRLTGNCPLHDGAETSFSVDRTANTWSCSTCGGDGTVVDLVMKVEAISRTHAIKKLLAGSFGPPAKGVKRSTTRRLTIDLDPEADDHDLLRRVVEYYVAELKQSPEALAYLEARGLVAPELIDTFHVGFSNRTLGYRLPAKGWKAGNSIRSRLARLGILRETGHERFRGSIVIPVFDTEGHVVQIHGRKITPKLRSGTPLHTRLPGDPHGVFNLAALTAKTIILCGSLIDALTVWCAGFHNVTGIPGLDGFSREHLAVLRLYEVEKVLLAFRRDDAGDGAAFTLAEQLAEVGITSHRVEFPRGMDANDYALANPPASTAFEVVFRNATWIGRGKSPEVEVEPEPATSPEPASTPPEQPTVPSDDHEVVIDLGDRRYRVRGLARNSSFDSLKVNLLVARPTVEQAGFHVDEIQLYHAKARAAYVRAAALEIGVTEDAVKHDLGRVLLKLEALQEELIRTALKPKAHAITMDEGARKAAMDLLADPRLLDRIVADFQRCGLVGEDANKLVGYLAAVSRKLDDPLALVVQSSSAAGKTSLMDAILAFVPEEDRVHFSAMTGQSLFYFGEASLKHKILAVAEEEGANQASYALKLLQSERSISIASTAKEPTTGRLVTQEYRVEGPTQLMLTTTSVEIDEELLNRCVVLTVNEDRAQTRAIHQLQRERETLEGVLARVDRAAVATMHQNAQRLLRPLLVVNPYARNLTFMDDRTRTRRDHGKYLALIRAVTFLHQYQRELKSVTHGGKPVSYIEVIPDDVAVANRLAHDVLGRSLDELPPQTRQLLLALEAMVAAECQAKAISRADYRFSRRFAREHLGIGDTQLKVHLGRLVDLEYVLAHRAQHGRGQLYELLYDGGGKDGAHFVTGLIDATTLRSRYVSERSGTRADRSGSGRPSVGPGSGDGREVEIDGKANSDAGLPSADPSRPENTRPGSVPEADEDPS